MSEVEFLGHIISPTGIRKTVDYVKKISEYPQPTTIGELREFLSFVNFQRKFLPNCFEIEKPLSCLTGGRRAKLLTWTPDMLTACNKLKTCNLTLNCLTLTIRILLINYNCRLMHQHMALVLNWHKDKVTRTES